ncbi:PhzF family phenazine biosynthesis protein [Alkalihalobacillus sp. MEB130]|uniref:PhzF family phenazine biosynthesis protein n=1 Tax=Alkalihalobacillus sp. MEB130 TaxID=2976704 RepID=UPI0028DDB676|nr:PhzF family phenazine biosynthesis protein [Alkalihalobacillus sp. MEB130]MDT8862863.1 PhzF family phenazine biosynthesis protein [Alkalihalobacillus sp. MEB130]
MKYFVVDAFAEKVFEGNPAGVCIMNDWISDELMQKIAIENNLSETAFAVKEVGHYRLRWFTPGGEINLCGHATLATAFIILNYYEKQLNTVKFNTISGELTVNKQDDLYELDFPSVPSEEIAVTNQMISALGIVPKETYLNRDLVFILESEEDVRNVSPDFAQLEKLPEGLGVCVTAKGSEFDFVSRAFFPKLKVNEDPVTGSLHCSLIPFWAKRLEKQELVARQLSSRGGTLYCKHEDTRVKMAGKAVLYSVAELTVE